MPLERTHLSSLRWTPISYLAKTTMTGFDCNKLNVQGALCIKKMFRVQSEILC